MIIYIVIINLLAFIITCLDKHYAKNNLYRIIENTLLSIALLGGSIGELLGMII